jgi:hypothetical protein
MNEAEETENFGKLPASLGLILRGSYADLHRILSEIEATLPIGCRILYKRYAPGGLMITGEGEK